MLSVMRGMHYPPFLNMKRNDTDSNKAGVLLALFLHAVCLSLFSYI